MSNRVVYKEKSFNLSGLSGISDTTLDMHFKLYGEHVEATNKLNDELRGMLTSGGVKDESRLAYSELKRRLGFEYNGMVLHEYFFGNLTSNGPVEPPHDSIFIRFARESFGSLENWKADFAATGEMKGVGWAICYRDPATGKLSNHWITLHDVGNVAGYIPIIVMDVWEHAYLLDYRPADKAKYVEALLSNLDWATVDRRLGAVTLASPTAA